jgi:hypothetical protein
VRVPHFDFWILAGRRTAATAIASFDVPDEKAQTALRLVVLAPSPEGSRDGQQTALESANAYLQLATRSRQSWAIQNDLVSLSLELAAAAHLGDVSPRRISSILSRMERAGRHVDVMSHAVQGGGPGLGKRS